MESKILRQLYNIDTILENLLIQVLDESIKSDSKEIGYMLDSINKLSISIKDNIYSK